MEFNDDDTLVNEHTFADGMLVLFEFVDSWTSLEIGGTVVESRQLFMNDKMHIF